VSLSERARELESYAADDRAPERLDTRGLLTRVADRYRDGDAGDIAVDVGENVSDICASPGVEQALEELVDNAFRHDPDPPTAVTLGARADDGLVEVTVVDDGPGIPDPEAAVIERGRETPLEHGTGLGLWLVNWIATRYGGSFQLDSTDAGTVATLRLPGIASDEPVAEAAQPPTTLFQ
jgi:signal transduction histidine kinase